MSGRTTGGGGGASTESESGRGNVTTTEPNKNAAPTAEAPRAASGGDAVVWKDGRKRRERILAKGDGKGPQHPTGFSKRYVFGPENNWTVTDMEASDVEFLKSTHDASEFRFDQKTPDED